ncbi:MAG: YaiO family outer membrane beta-barrel protein [Croceibacterium sp.]
MKSGAVLAALAALALPCAALAQQASAYDRAVAARHDGRPAEAAALLRAWLAEHPEDVDAKLQLAFAELALGRLDEAEAGFRAVLAAAPDYADARAGLDQIAARRANPAFGQRAELTVEGALSELEGAASDWHEAGARLRAPAGELTTVEVAGTYYRRFGLEDVELAGTVVHRAGQDLWVRGEASITPNADFRPQWGLAGGLDWRLRGGDAATVLTLDARYQDFPAQHVTTLSPGLVQYFARGRAWITARAFGVIPEGGDLQVGWLVRGDVAPADRYRLFAGIADGPDTDLGVVTDVTSLFGGFEVPLGERVGVIGSVGRDWREAGADRTDFRLGVKVGL